MGVFVAFERDAVTRLVGDRLASASIERGLDAA